MTTRLTAFLTLLALAACGADGPPEQPEPKPKPGITISGTAEIGITGGS